MSYAIGGLGMVGGFLGQMANRSRGYKINEYGNISYFRPIGPITKEEHDSIELVKRAKAFRKIEAKHYSKPFSYPPHPEETRQQRRARERLEAKMDSGQYHNQSQKGIRTLTKYDRFGKVIKKAR